MTWACCLDSKQPSSRKMRWSDLSWPVVTLTHANQMYTQNRRHSRDEGEERWRPVKRPVWISTGSVCWTGLLTKKKKKHCEKSFWISGVLIFTRRCRLCTRNSNKWGRKKQTEVSLVRQKKAKQPGLAAAFILVGFHLRLAFWQRKWLKQSSQPAFPFCLKGHLFMVYR